MRTSASDTCEITNTSSATLSGIPISAEVRKAYLYWTGSFYKGEFYDDSTETVTLNGVRYNDFNLDTAFYDTNNFYDVDLGFYGGKADVTNTVRSTRNGVYTLSGLDIDNNQYSDSDHCQNGTVLGAWAILVIFEDTNEDLRVLNLFDGFEIFQGSALTLIPNNFEVSATPSGKHAHITWEGDEGNSFSVNGFSESLVFEGEDLTDSDNPVNNQFNSVSNIYSSNTLGADVDVYDISRYLNPGETSVTTQYSSGQDLVILNAEIISVSNVAVADLAVTTSQASGWLQGSQVSKKFTITNNGPNSVPANSVEFTTTLPSELSFNGIQGSSDWSCTQSGQQLTCRLVNGLRSGWSEYIDLNLNVANGTAGSTSNLLVQVNHDNAPYDIFDNQQLNNSFQLNVPITSVAQVDLSASSKTYQNLAGDLLLAGDTLQYEIVIDDASDLSASNIRVTDNLPDNISGYSITYFPSEATNNSNNSGGTNGTGFLDISGIDLAPGETEFIRLEVYIDNSAPEGASLRNTAELLYGSDSWTVDTGNITVVDPDLSASTKQAEDINGGFLLPGDTVRYTIDIQESNGLEITGLSLTDNLPAFIDSYSISGIPAGAIDNSSVSGGSNGTGQVQIDNLSLGLNETISIIIDAVVANDAPDQTSLQNTAVLTINSETWNEQSNDLIVSLSSSTPTTGNKPLYLFNNNDTLSRVLPTNNTSQIFRHNETITWQISPALQDEFILEQGISTLELQIEGYRTGNIQSRFLAQLFYNDNNGSGDVLIAENQSSYGNFRINQYYNVVFNFDVPDDITIPAESTVFLRINNESSNGSNNQYSRIGVHAINPNTNKTSKVTLKAKTVINVDSVEIYNLAFSDTDSDFVDDSGAVVIANSTPDTDLSIRATISDPFGAFDITNAEIAITKADGSAYDFSGVNQMQALDDPSDDSATNTKTFEKVIALAEENEVTGYWSIEVTGFEGNETGTDQVTHTTTKLFLIKPFQPNVNLSKTIEVINDPINGPLSAGNKPKAIPGAEIQYIISAINTGRGKSDSNSIVLQDEIPQNAELFIGDLSCSNRGPGSGLGPICFEEGAAPNESGLTYDFSSITDLSDDIAFSIDGSDFSYEPSDEGDGYDSNIRFIRVSPSGELLNASKDGSAEPSFNFIYQIRLQQIWSNTFGEFYDNSGAIL